MPPTFAAFLCGLFIASLAICSSAVIDTGKIPSVMGKMPVFRNFWVYGNISRLATQIPHNIKFQEYTNGSVIRFSWNAFTVDSLTFSVKSDKSRKLNFGNIPDNAMFVAFDGRNTIYENVESASSAGQDLKYICLILSDHFEWRQWLRSQTLNLIANVLPAMQLPPGTFMACVHVTSRGVSTPKSLPLIDTTAVFGFRSNYLLSMPNMFTFQEGIVKCEGKEGMTFEKILVHGNITDPVAFGESVVHINDGYNAVTITAESVAVDNPIYFAGLDGESGSILVLKDFQTRPDFSAFMAVDKGRSVTDLRSGMKLAKKSYVCLAFSLLPETINILRKNIFSLIRGTFRLPVIPAGSLLVCVQVTRSFRTPKIGDPSNPITEVDNFNMSATFDQSQYTSEMALNTLNPFGCKYSDLESYGYNSQISYPGGYLESSDTDDQVPVDFPDVSLEGTGFKVPDSAIPIVMPIDVSDE